MIYYSVMIMNEVLIPGYTGMNLETVVLSEGSQKKRLAERGGVAVGSDCYSVGSFFLGVENVMKLDCDDGYTSLNVLKPLNCIF